MSCSREWPLTIRMKAGFELASDAQTSNPERSGKPTSKHDHVGFERLGQLETQGAAGRQRYFVAGFFERAAFEVRDLVVVLDHQDTA